jgi:opacity protein-like surface antigen
MRMTYLRSPSVPLLVSASFFSVSIRCLAIVVVLALPLMGTATFGQARPTSARPLDLQLGGGYSTASGDYEYLRLQGFGIYGTVDFKPHFGAEIDFHQINNSDTKVYQRTYEFGGRYFRTYGSLKPYLKALYGRGVLNFQDNIANLAYNMFVGGGGVDIAVKPYLNVRLDYEYQNWLSGPGIEHGLNPQVISAGVAYHFGRGAPKYLLQ